jgi:hypothetical protein
MQQIAALIRSWDRGASDMEPVFYVMAILGCGDFNDQCQQARIEQTRYTSVAQCQAAMAEILPRHADLSFPTIAATCQRQGQQMARVETLPNR